MDDEMIERCTEAVSDSMDLMDKLDETAAKTYTLACIKAMREPTEKMIVAGFDNTNAVSSRVIWQAMIDAIIGDKE